MEKFPFNPEAGEMLETKELALDTLSPGDQILLYTPYRLVALQILGGDQRQPYVAYAYAKKSPDYDKSSDWINDRNEVQLKGVCSRVIVVEGETQFMDPTPGLIEVSKHALLARRSGNNEPTEFATGLIDNIFCSRA